MLSALIPKMNVADVEVVYLLDRYSSAEYFSELLNTWRDFVAHNEGSLARYAANLPPDFR